VGGNRNAFLNKKATHVDEQVLKIQITNKYRQNVSALLEITYIQIKWSRI
jgi:hypothetical protein